MSLKKIIRLTVLVGLISVGLLFYFYIEHKNFSKNHKEFLLTSTSLQLEQTRLTNNILHSSLKVYFNQDIIAKNVLNLTSTLKKLENTKILKNKNYTLVKANLFFIKELIDVEIQNIEKFTMLNAGIKNSMLFLNRNVNNTIFKEHQKLYMKALVILKHITDTKNTLDLDNLDGLELTLKTKSNKKEIKKLIKYFNAHIKYLSINIPKFIKVTNDITNNKISQNISNLNKSFSKIAINDFKAFDNFSFFVLTIFSISLVLFSTVFYKYIAEQKKLSQAKASLENALIHDELTGLKNRKSFEKELLKHEKPFILLVNIIGFKNINDIYGNDAGNLLLKEFSSFLQTYIKSQKNTHLYRLGSDEFSIIYTNINKKEALFIASTLEQQIGKHNFDILNTHINLQVNISLNNIKPYLENADLALKLLKKDYSKSILLFQRDFEIKKDIANTLDVIDKIKRAIEDDRVIPYFQPIVNLQTMKIEKYESLIRIKCKDGTILQPYQFLDLSKKSSYYNKLTKLMIEKTLSIAKEYPQYRFSINISMQDINNDELISDIFDEFDQDHITSSRIDIELLESEDMYDKNKIINFIEKLNSYGINISIDDFGTGYSNFSYFSDFEIQYLKIDGSITKEITTNPKKLHIFKSIYQFSKGMNIDNIAEFVETKESLDILQEMGVKYAQGYYFSKPLPRPLNSNEIIL